MVLQIDQETFPDWKWTNLLSINVIGSLGKSTFSKILGLNPNINELNKGAEGIKSALRLNSERFRDTVVNFVWPILSWGIFLPFTSHWAVQFPPTIVKMSIEAINVISLVHLQLDVDMRWAHTDLELRAVDKKKQDQPCLFWQWSS